MGVPARGREGIRHVIGAKRVEGQMSSEFFVLIASYSARFGGEAARGARRRGRLRCARS